MTHYDTILSIGTHQASTQPLTPPASDKWVQVYTNAGQREQHVLLFYPLTILHLHRLSIFPKMTRDRGLMKSSLKKNLCKIQGVSGDLPLAGTGQDKTFFPKETIHICFKKI